MSARCSGTPISWLALERYHGGDLPEAERARVETHIDGCEACASCLREITGDARQLPPLPARKPGRVVRLGRVMGASAGVLAMAAAIALFLGRARPGVDPDRVKGGDVAFVLVGDDATQIAEAGGAFAEGRRYKVLVTCPPSMRASWDLAVFEGARTDAVFPLPPARELSCGNGVPLEGAFRVTGREPLRVCLVWSEGGDLVARPNVRADGERSVCKTLVPAGE